MLTTGHIKLISICRHFLEGLLVLGSVCHRDGKGCFVRRRPNHLRVEPCFQMVSVVTHCQQLRTQLYRFLDWII